MDTKPLAVGTVVRGRYRVLRLVAGGGMSWIYQVQEERPEGSSAVWALKELRLDTMDRQSLDEARTLFEQEANLLVRLAHPNLPKVAAFFVDEGRSYLVMEFVHGVSLQKRLDTAQGPLLQSEVLPYAIQICEVLAYLHAQPSPIIFRDLKPSNMMVTPSGQIKLIDFGIARTYKQGQNRDTVSMGSENYAAPEQWGRAQSDARTDIYGLGATLYHLLTGSPPLPTFVPGAREPVDTVNPAVSAELAQIVEKAMASEREARYESALAMRQALIECLPLLERLRLRTPGDRQRGPAGDAPLQASPTPAAPTAPFAAASIPIADRYCGTCGAGNSQHARFCRHCGQRLEQELAAELLVLEPAGWNWSIPLLGSSVLIGRPHGQRPVDLDVSPLDPDGYVSRNHAVIEAGDDGHSIVDLASSNGTAVNGSKLRPHQACRLGNGDQIRMGKMLLTYRVQRKKA